VREEFFAEKIVDAARQNKNFHNRHRWHREYVSSVVKKAISTTMALDPKLI